jgi:hypothetical protein
MSSWMGVVKYGVTMGVIWVYAWRMRAIPWFARRSSRFAPFIRRNVVKPMTRSNASTTAATERKSWPKEDIAWATRARATKDIERNVRNMPARTNASL